MTDKWEDFSEVSVEVPSTESATLVQPDDYSDEKDNAPLLPGGGESKPREMPSFFSIEFYRKCWDVTTNEVRLRVKSACYPRSDFIRSLHGKPDLYGPFWVSVTLCFSTAICGNLANFIQNQGDPLYKYTPEFERVTSAASAIFGYAFIFPFFISVVLYYSKIMCGFSTVELLTSYGYSLSIFIPISFMWMLPSEFIRWLLVIIGAVVSGAVVCLPIWQGLKVMSNKKIAYGIIALAIGANVALSVGFKMYFFEAPLTPMPSIPAADIPVIPEAPAEVNAAPIEPEVDPKVQELVEQLPAAVDPDAPVEGEPEAAEVAPVADAAVEPAAAEVPAAPEAPVEAPVAAPAEPAAEVNVEEEKHEEEVKSVLAGLPRAASPIQAVNQPPPPPAEPVEADPPIASDEQAAAAPVAEAAPVAPVAEAPAPAQPAEGGSIVLPRVG